MTAGPSPSSPELSPPPGPKIYRVGTLQYTQQELRILFIWLMWNNFTIMLLENVNSFSKFLQIDHGATYSQIAVFGAIGTIMNVLINPFFSVWSDNTRTRWGRRRPFLLIAAPPLAVCIAAVPYMPDLYTRIVQVPFIAWLFHFIPMNGAAFTVAFCGLVLTIFNSVVLALFSYLYWDVVPQEVLGRWTALTGVVGALGLFLWGFFLMGFATEHMKALCVSVSLFCLTVYLISIVKVKEGGYPPAPKDDGRGFFGTFRDYFTDCYSDPYYLWIFGAFAVAGIANASNDYKGYFLKYDLHTDYGMFGKLNAIPNLVPLILGYLCGSIADRLRPLRVVAPTFFLWGLVCLGSFFFIVDKTTFLFWTSLTQLAIFANGVVYGALLPQLYPRAKFGQFCSANQLVASVTGVFVPIPVGMLFDHLHNTRYAYLFSSIFLFAGSAMFVKVRILHEQRVAQGIRVE